MNKRNEIGGGYWISQKQIESSFIHQRAGKGVCFISDDEQHLSTCRSGLSYIADLYDRRVIIVPYFTCSTVIDPFLEKGWKVIPYSIDSHLLVNWEQLRLNIIAESPSLILFHSYFGFPTVNNNLECINWIKAQGIDIINDVTCSILSTFDRIYSDFCVGSIRKWFPIPDGALLQGTRIAGLSRYNQELLDAKVDAFITKWEYLEGADVEKTKMLQKFSRATHIIDSASEVFIMSPLSKALLTKENVDDAKRIRRMNYNRLFQLISNINRIILPFPEADENVIPYFLPIIVQDRNILQKYLADNGVYATVLWTKPENFAHLIEHNLIYEKILCFPINQCYDISDMERIGCLLNKYFKEK